MPTEEINILNIDVEPSQPEGFDVQLDLQEPNSPILSLGVVLPMGGGGAINSISVNGVEVPIIEGNVDIAVPTSTSELVNDSGFITSSAITGKVDRTELAQVAFTGSYNDLEDKPEIPSLDGYATETYVGNAVSAHNESTTAHTDIRNEISGINELIPEQATTDNQLADKAFVNSSIATETATFRGTYNEVTDLSLTTAATHSEIAATLVNVISLADSNDYCFVQIPTADATPTEIASIERYKFVTGAGWQYEYTLNNSGFTAAQWAAINSGITTGLVTQIGTNASDILTIQGAIATLTTGLSGKVSKAGDTMTGNLTLNTDVKILLPSNSDVYDYYLSNEGDRVYLRRIRKDGTGTPYTIQEWRSGSVYLRDAYIGGQQSQNIAVNYQRVNYPSVDTSATLVGGITHLNELGTIDYSTIALPANPGTAEYNGTFTSTTSGDISVSLPLTYWSGETNIVAGRTYSFSIQNGIGFIIQMN